MNTEVLLPNDISETFRSNVFGHTTNVNLRKQQKNAGARASLRCNRRWTSLEGSPIGANAAYKTNAAKTVNGFTSDVLKMVVDHQKWNHYRRCPTDVQK